MPQQKKQGKKGKRRDERPAKARYWDTKALQTNKVRRIMKSHRMTKEEATKYWLEARTTRRKGTLWV